MKIIRLQSENVKRLKAVDITPTSPVVVIGGQNGQGKSSVLDSIAMALGGSGEAPDMPVRQGEKGAKIVLELDGLVIKRTFTAAGGTALVVENKEGARYPKPQDMLDKLTGKLTFDPLEFIRLKPAAQAEALKKLVGLDLTHLETERKRLYDERTYVNREAASARARADFMPHHELAPTELVVVTDIVAERDAAKEHNAKAKGLLQAKDEAEGMLRNASAGAESVMAEIVELEAKLSKLRAKAKEYVDSVPAIQTRMEAATRAVAMFVPVDLSPINLKMANAETVNQQVRQNQARATAIAEAKKVEDKADTITEQIAKIDAQKSERLSATTFPVEGLSFGETGVTFKSVPFSQASGAEKLRVSLAMAAATNPKLPVMLIRDGSLLDDESMKLISGFAAERGLQVWIERVGDGDASAVIIEDGEVAAPSVPETASAPIQS
jgi:DNA repair exonuclease SbcCD ATPase subunit